jgi:hypothetical protein
MEPSEPDRELEREQVVLVEIEVGQLLDPSQALAQRVGMNEQGPGAVDHAAPLRQVSLQRVQQGCAALVVVGDQQVNGRPHPVVGRVLGGDLD